MSGLVQVGDIFGKWELVEKTTDTARMVDVVAIHDKAAQRTERLEVSIACTPASFVKVLVERGLEVDGALQVDHHVSATESWVEVRGGGAHSKPIDDDILPRIHPRAEAYERASIALREVVTEWRKQHPGLTSAETLVLLAEEPARFARRLVAVERRER